MIFRIICTLCEYILQDPKSFEPPKEADEATLCPIFELNAKKDKVLYSSIYSSSARHVVLRTGMLLLPYHFLDLQHAP